jgi:hypothetical protein
MEEFCVEIMKEDVHLLPLTNIGAFTSASMDADHFIYCTHNRQAFDAWIRSLSQAGRRFRIVQR